MDHGDATDLALFHMDGNAAAEIERLRQAKAEPAARRW